MVVTFFPIHNIVVVTSPIGDQAPPAFAAIIINPANQILVSLLGTTFCKIVIKTIVAVKLSIMAERTKAKIAKIHSNFLLDLVFLIQVFHFYQNKLFQLFFTFYVWWFVYYVF